MFKIEIIGEDQEALNILPEELGTICRLCLNKNGTVELFEKKSKQQVGKFSELLSYLSLLQVDKNDGLPQKVCNTCATLINEFFFFKEQVNASQVILQIALGKVKIQDKVTNINIQNKNVKSDKAKNYSLICKEEIKIINEDINEIKVENDDIELDYGEVSPIGIEEINESPETSEQNLEKKPGYTCKNCGETFDERKEFLKHRKREVDIKRKITGNLNRIPCTLCNKMIVRDRIQDHMNTHTKTKPHICEICGKRFCSRPNLYTHKVIHREVKPHVCEICGKGFSQGSSLRDHMLSHTDEKLICHICGVTTLTRRSLYQHQKNHLKTNYTPNPNLIGRKRVISGKKTCDICNKEFATSQRLGHHMYVHTGEKPLKCSLCDSRFVQVGQLNCHMRIHTGEKPYECTYCGKRFAINGNLQQHIKTHTGERPYSCDICKKSFYTNSSLRKHSKIHNRIKCIVYSDTD